MDVTLTRAATPPATPQPQHTVRRLLRRLSALAYAAAERLTSPPRNVPPEYYRFPPL